MYLKKLFALLALATLIISCASKKNENSVKESFLKFAVKGQVNEKITCKNDQSNSYALYLPSTYSTKKAYPIIYAFDSHGDGNLPVQLFRNCAEKYGYIVVGSNNCQNGMSSGEITATVAELLSDTKTKLSIDTERIYTAGFSGGSRVASSVAQSFGHVRGVIGCSAGFTINGPNEKSFDFIGIAGNQDMNYLEMAELEENLKHTSMRHYFLVFEGKHKWPPEGLISEAVFWLETNAMRDKIITKNLEQINHFIDDNNNLIKKYKSNKNVHELYATYNKMAAFLKGLSDVSTYESGADSMLKIPALKKELELSKSLQMKEQEKQQLYQEAFQNKELNWWKTEIKQLDQEIQKGGQESLMNKRLMAYISLAAFSYTNYSLRSRDYGTAAKFLFIYGSSDPENPDYHYFSAVYFANTNDSKKAIESLKKAIGYGYTDFGKLRQEPAFANLQGIPGFEELFSTQTTIK
jgi:hypothetical protein